VRDLQVGEHDLLKLLSPDSLLGAGIYLLIFVVLALVLARVLRLGLGTAMARHAAHIDRTTVSFLQQIGSAAVWVLMLILYAHLIPALRAMGTALLAGASVASVVIGLAAQSTLGNLVAGVAITLYRPFRLGDTLQVTAPSGTETGNVELISLGYTTLRTADGRYVVLPNSVAASQVTVNLTHLGAAAPLKIVIRVSRETDLDAARELAVRIAHETAGANTPVSCVLTSLETSSAVFELQLTAAADAAALRTRLITQLAKGFATAGFDAPPERRASFS